MATDYFTDKSTAVLTAVVRPSWRIPHAMVAYRLLETGEDLHYPIRLLTTRPHFGGVRWWLECPGRQPGEKCSRRVATLFMPAWGRQFACRRCYDLGYTCSQLSHRYDRLACNFGLSSSEVNRMLRGR
jgi:hypothetical protein